MSGNEARFDASMFFQNRTCRHFPCHGGIAPERFNCLLCYCPLYALGEACGGNFTYTAKGVKNCRECAIPHDGDSGVRLVRERFGELAALAARGHQPLERGTGEGLTLILGGIASGKRTYALSLGIPREEMAFDVHELVRAGEDPRLLAESLCGKRVVTCAEVGSGIVPVDGGERTWREDVGRLAQLLAERAQTVVRMTAGIPTILKGDPLPPSR